MRCAKWVAFAMLIIVTAFLLTGCATPDIPVNRPVAAKDHLPDVPADIRRCFNEALSTPPDRGMTVAEVEQAWKSDRVRAVVMRGCGKRFAAWYDDLRGKWR